MDEILVIEADIWEEITISGIWGKITLFNLEEIEKEVAQNHQPSNDPDDWYTVRCNVTYENGGRHDPSYWLLDEVGRKPIGPSANNDMRRYLVQFDNDSTPLL